MSFRIWTIFWLFALVASALATFGVVGLLYVSLIVLFWWCLWDGLKLTTLSTYRIHIVIALFVLAELVFLPAVVETRRANRISRGEEIEDSMLHSYQKPELDYQKCYALSVFVLLSLAPLIRLAPAMRSIAANQSIAPQSETSAQPTEK